MVDLDFNNTLHRIVEAMLPRFSPWDEGILITVELRVSYYDKAEEDMNYVPGCRVHILFIRPNNYTRVMAASGKDWSTIPAEAWRMYADHDSCWSTDGFRLVSDTFRQMQESVPKGQKPQFGCSIHDIIKVKAELEHYEEKGFSRKRMRPTKIKVQKSPQPLHSTSGQ